MRTRVHGLILGLALLAWMALPIALELRPPFNWDIPLGTVMNADPEPPWPMVLHSGESAAIAGAAQTDTAVLPPPPAARGAVGAVRIESDPRREPVVPAADLLTLHQRRNE
jgi:hypothetical protein